MTQFLFWNLNKKLLQNHVVRLTEEHDVDVLMLAENIIPHAELLAALNTSHQSGYHLPFSLQEKINVFVRFSDQFIEGILETSRYTIRHIKLPGLTEILRVVVHFPSKLHWNSESQAIECTNLANSIREAEDKVGHSRTVLVGDLNMNPFESGLVGQLACTP